MNSEKCFINKTENSVTIGNGYIERSFSLKNNQLKTECIINKRTDDELKLVPADGSEEFAVSVFAFAGSKKEIKCSDLTVESVKVLGDDESKNLVIVFSAYEFKGNSLSFSIKYTVNSNDHFIKKQLSFTSDNDQKIRIDYIDTERIALGNGIVQRWSRPDMKKAFLSGFQSALGQPVYINAIFFGSEFPMNDNNIVNGVMRLRYYSGKTLNEMKGEKSEYCAWQTVCGTARSVDFDVIRADFLEYIKTISQKLYLRTQYNSWYDHMMEIDAENIVGSFFEIEKGLSQYGVKPVNAYVVDDGWNDYEKNFWSFNKKFPNELYDSSALAKKFSSNFGLWLGPRGGYNYNKKFGKQMQKAGTGGYNKRSMDICIADSNYVKNISDLFIDFMDRFDIDYWKLDGFMRYTCRSKHHGHPTGGFNDMYCLTDCWEKWIKIFERMRGFRSSQNKNLWINLTCYAVPSPWFLQWVNSIWMQNSDDIGFIDKTKDSTAMHGKDFDRMLTYRDKKYFDFHKTRMYQFPNSNMYNHEPIYGNTAKVHMEDDEYRKYMYMIATRGTAFWELYYSYNLFNPAMWRINADVLRFIEDDFHILRNAKLIGDSPDTGKIYGYSAWDGDEGIVSLRNPMNTELSFSTTLDRIIGVAENASNLSRVCILPYGEANEERTYSYGDKLDVTLKPHEIRIFKFTSKQAKAPVLVSSKFVDDKTVELVFNKRIVTDENSFTVNGKPLQSQLLENYSDVRVNVNTPEDGNTAEIFYSVSDVYGNVIIGNTKVTYHKNGIITAGAEISGEFTMKMTADASATETVLFSQGNNLAVSLSNGKVRFDCAGVTAKGSADIAAADGTEITLVRERNSMIKIYVNSKLDGSGFDNTIFNPDISEGEIKIARTVKNLAITDKALAFDEV